jgi:hypothetical protein
MRMSISFASQTTLLRSRQQQECLVKHDIFLRQRTNALVPGDILSSLMDSLDPKMTIKMDSVDIVRTLAKYTAAILQEYVSCYFFM